MVRGVTTSLGLGKIGAPVRVAAGAWLCLITSCVALQPLSAAVPAANAAPAAVPSAPVQAGPLALTAQVDTAKGQVLVTATLGHVVARQVLTLASPVLPLDLADGPLSARGRVMLRFAAAPQLSAVTADVVAADGAGSHRFRGAVASWLAAAPPILYQRSFDLAADLSIQVTVRGAAGNTAEVAFYSGSLRLGALTAMQLSPRQIFVGPLQAGSVRVEPGATITLTIPTALQKGMLFLQATFSTATTPATTISASVAQWPLPPAPEP